MDNWKIHFTKVRKFVTNDPPSPPHLGIHKVQLLPWSHKQATRNCK